MAHPLLKPTLQPRLPELLVHGAAATEIGVQDLIGAGKGQKALPVLISRPSEQGSAELSQLPRRSPFHSATLIAVARDSPGRFLQLQDVLLHIAIELAGDNVADGRVSPRPAGLLIEKAAVQAAMIGTSERYFRRVF